VAGGEKKTKLKKNQLIYCYTSLFLFSLYIDIFCFAFIIYHHFFISPHPAPEILPVLLIKKKKKKKKRKFKKKKDGHRLSNK